MEMDRRSEAPTRAGMGQVIIAIIAFVVFFGGITVLCAFGLAKAIHTGSLLGGIICSAGLAIGSCSICVAIRTIYRRYRQVNTIRPISRTAGR
jgi:hypothetical protein